MEGVVLNRVGISEHFSPNMVRVSDPEQHPFTQTWVKCPPPTPLRGIVVIVKYHIMKADKIIIS